MSDAAPEERHATWLELFFDLVIVAAVAQLAHLLHDGPGIRDVFLFAVLYYAMWTVWTSLTLYANVSGRLTRQRSMLLAMFGIAVMAASVRHVADGEPAIFVVAYIWCRLLAVGSWKRASRLMTEWPAVQQAVGVVPWMVSLGFEAPVRYWLWAAGIVLDVTVSVVRSRHPDELLASERAEQDRAWTRRVAVRLRRGRPVPEREPDLESAPPDRPHLGERLGLFVIIVLGEAVAQLVNATAEVPRWDRPLWAVLLTGFGLLVTIWWLTLRYGAGAAPTYGVRVFALRLTMPMHYLTPAAIVLIAAGLGAVAEHEEGHLPEANRWVLCAGVALYFLTALVTGSRGGASLRWVLGWGVPAVVAPVVLGLLGGPLPAWALIAVLLGVALWHVAYRRFDTHPAAPA